MKNIPDQVKLLAEQEFSSEPEYTGTIDGSDVYTEHKEESEAPAPTGMPVAILWDGSHAKLVEGIEALNLLASFEEP